MRVLFVSLFVVIVDQISKLWIKGFSIPFLHLQHKGMQPGQRIEVIGSFFQITFVENPGMAFSIDLNSNLKLLVSLFSIIACLGLVYYLYYVRNKNFSLRFSLALILGGAVGNLIDRMFYGIFYNYSPFFHGYVVDFLDFDFWKFSLFGRNFDRWPVFNVADTAVSIGVIILLLFYKQHENENKVVRSAEESSAGGSVQNETGSNLSEKSETKGREEDYS